MNAAHTAHNPAVIALFMGLSADDLADARAYLDEVRPGSSAVSDRHESALAVYRKRYAVGYVDAFIARRIGTDPALLVNLVIHFAGGDETRFGLPYMAQRFGWTRATYESARKAARDAGLLIERSGAGFDRRLRLSVDMAVFERIEREESRHAFNFARRKKSLAYMVRGLEIDADDGDNEADTGGQNPVDNSENEGETKGSPLVETQHLQGFPLVGIQHFEASENDTSLEEESGIGISNSVGIPARERQPGDDDDEIDEPTPAPPAPAKPDADTETATQTLVRGMGAMGLDVEPEAVRAYCKLRSVTPAEAAAAIQAGRDSPNSDNIGGFNYFKKVIENNRKEGKRATAQSVQLTMAHNHALEQIKRINGEQKRITPTGEQHAAAALAAARKARDKARSRS